MLGGGLDALGALVRFLHICVCLITSVPLHANFKLKR